MNRHSSTWVGAVCMAASVLLSAADAYAITLDRSGTLNVPNLQITCSSMTKKACSEGGDLIHSYSFKGDCVVLWNGGVYPAPGVKIGAIWNGAAHTAKESISTSSGKSLAVTYSCGGGDPWVTSDGCSVTAYTNGTGLGVFDQMAYYGSFAIPLSRSLVTPQEAQTLFGQCGSGSPPPPPPPPAKTGKIDISAAKSKALLQSLRPSAPTIEKPTEGWAECTAVPLKISSSSSPQNPNTKLTVQFQDVKSGCSNLDSDACWQNVTVAGYAGPINQPAINTTIQRSAFPGFGHWRVRAAVSNQKGFTSAFTDWRRFRVPGTQACP